MKNTMMIGLATGAATLTLMLGQILNPKPM